MTTKVEDIPANGAIPVSIAVFGKLRDLVSGTTPHKGSPKITMIKLVREYWKDTHPGRSLGLRDAKLAVERWIDEESSGARDSKDTRPRIIPVMSLKSLNVDFGEGEIVIDLEELQFRSLAGVTSIGFEAVGRMLDLVSVLRAWESGKRVGVLDEPIKEKKEGTNDEDLDWI